MLNITQDTTLRSLEWFLFFGLCGLSAYFMLEVLDKFFSEDTSFKVYEEPIDKIPTLTLCVSELTLGARDTTVYEYGIDFNITYLHTFLDQGKWLGDSVNLIEGTNYLASTNNVSYNRIVYFTKLSTAWSGICYKINEVTSLIQDGEWRYINMYFNKTLSRENLPSWRLYFTSEKNAYGILRNWWFDGELDELILEGNTTTTIQLKVQKHMYHNTSKFTCGDQSLYECWGSKILTENFDECPKKCLPYSFPMFQNSNIPLCITDEEYNCAHSKVNIIMEKITKTRACPKLCTVFQYSARETLKWKILQDAPDHIRFWYGLQQPSNVMVNEEYLIYDTITMISSVGGTLGMCIGFSFTNIIANIFALIQKLRNIIKLKVSTKKLVQPLFVKPVNNKQENIKLEDDVKYFIKKCFEEQKQLFEHKN